MFDREFTLYAFLLRYARRLVADVPDAEFADQPIAGATHPAWVLGHLAIAADFALSHLGEPPACPPTWWQIFGPGSKVQADRGAYPSKAELLAAVTSGHEHVVETVHRTPPEAFARPQAGPFYLEDFPTVGELVAYLMTTHSSLHLGQLSAWRRMKGLPSVLGI